MNNWKLYQWMLLAVGVVGALALVITGVKLDRMAHVLAGYKAKVTCSEVFLAGRDAQMIIENEFVGIDPAMDKISVHPDLDNRQVSASAMLGLGRARAIYREGYGCTLANAGRLSPLPAATPALAIDPWPMAAADSGEAIPRVNYGAMDAALTRAFDENDASHRAVLVIVDGKIVDERYADGFNKDTPFLSWSAGKSVIATLVGAAVLNEVVDIYDPAPVESWKSDSVRATITWNNLLHMQSGLDFSEVYTDMRSDVNRMLFEAADVGAIPEKSSSAYAPGTHWYYSSGTTN
ncbi:MAG: serine hydrolase, partial [Marinicaulis sp.]|nr:serine hydrolase [Marinicaulis sp.]